VRPTDISPKVPSLAAWKGAFSDASGQRFSEIVAPDAVLEGSIFPRPIIGREAVWDALRLSASIYNSLGFTHEASCDDRTYLEWEATALGLQMWGVTVLTRNVDRLIMRVALHHRPFAAVTRFSAQLESLAEARSRHVAWPTTDSASGHAERIRSK
jgi:hypothetical protein